MSSSHIVCSDCGAASTTGVGYTRRRRKTLCGVCARRKKHESHTLEAWWMVLVGIGALISRWVSAESLVTSILTAFSLPYLVGLLVTLIHEAAHGLVAVLTGMRVLGFQIGVGPRLAMLGGDRFHLDLRLLPLGGHTVIAPEDILHRGRQLVTTLAGPLSGGILLLIAWQWEAPVGGWWSITRVLVVLSAAMSMVINLVPIRSLNNDGWRIGWLLTAPDQEVQSASELAERNALANELAPASTVDRSRLEEIRDDLTARIADVGLGSTQRAMLLNNAAVANLRLQDPTSLEEAERLAREAFELLPYQPEIQDTLGVALVMLGRDEEGIPLLERALPALTAEQAAEGRTLLALAHIRNGNLYEARHHYLNTRDTGLAGPVFDETTDRIARAELRNLVAQFNAETPDAIAQKLREAVGSAFAQDLGRRLHEWRDTVGAAEAESAVDEWDLAGSSRHGSSILDDLISALLATT